jgi:hypothetical protein
VSPILILSDQCIPDKKAGFIAPPESNQDTSNTPVVKVNSFFTLELPIESAAYRYYNSILEQRNSLDSFELIKNQQIRLPKLGALAYIIEHNYALNNRVRQFEIITNNYNGNIYLIQYAALPEKYNRDMPIAAEMVIFVVR